MPKEKHLEKEKGTTPLYIRVYSYYKTLIVTGKMPAGTKLPSIRRCAEELSVSRTTAEAAYFQLAADGYVFSKPQSGFYVTETHLQSAEENTVVQGKDKQEKILYDFTSLSADRDSFDFPLWRRYIKSALRQDERLLSYGEAQGEYELRASLCTYIKGQRNAVCTPDNIVIGAGIQSLLHILCSMLLPEKTVYFEDESFMQGTAVFQDHGYQIVPKKENANILYVSPSHMNRWGDVMPIAKRLELLRLAEKNHKLIIEDDYDSEFGYINRPSPSLQGLDGGRNVVYIGTFSKLLLPSIRLSFMILPDSLMPAYQKKAELYNQTASKTEQIALGRYIGDGKLNSRVRKIKKLYAQKAKQLSIAIKDVFGNKAEVRVGETGFFVRMILKTSLTESEIESLAHEKGIMVQGVGARNKRPQILLSCSSIPTEEFHTALRLLYDSIF